MTSAPSPPSPDLLSGIPSLLPHATLTTPSTTTSTSTIRTWSSQPHPSPHTPLLATASSDRNVYIWDMRTWKLVSTISGGHKRSVRCVGWKDYGLQSKRRRLETSTDGEERKKTPVVLATGSFDANCGIWLWNRDGQSQSEGGERQQQQTSGESGNVPGAFEDPDDTEQDFTHQDDGPEEEWLFSTLLTGPDSEIKSLSFSPAHYGANLLATSSRDKSVWIWEEVEPEEWETVAVLGEHTGDVKCVAWNGGAGTSKRELRRRLQARQAGRVESGLINEPRDQKHGVDDEEIILGQRELLATASYDDTIRLHHDDESEGDWITISVITGHEGTVWSLKFEPFLNLSSYPSDTTEDEIIADWSPRLLSCSDDLSIRIWRKIWSDKERIERGYRLSEARRSKNQTTHNTDTGGAWSTSQQQQQTTGFAGRIPSTIRVGSSTERWEEESRLPNVHVRSVYGVDWSSATGLVVSCGGDGLIAVYREVAVTAQPQAENDNDDDVVMNGTTNTKNTTTATDQHDENTSSTSAPTNEQEEGETMAKVNTEWRVVAAMEEAHDEFEVNHVCWAGRRDARTGDGRGGDGAGEGEEEAEAEAEEEEYIVSTGDDSRVKVWRLPRHVWAEER